MVLFVDAVDNASLLKVLHSKHYVVLFYNNPWFVFIFLMTYFSLINEEKEMYIYI